MSSLLHVLGTLYIIKNIFSKYSVCVCICCYMTSSKICHLYSSLSLIWTRILRFDLNWSSKFVHYIPGMAVFKQSCQTVRQKERLWALTLLALELCRFLHQTHTHTAKLDAVCYVQLNAVFHESNYWIRCHAYHVCSPPQLKSAAITSFKLIIGKVGSGTCGSAMAKIFHPRCVGTMLDSTHLLDISRSSAGIRVPRLQTTRFKPFQVKKAR